MDASLWLIIVGGLVLLVVAAFLLLGRGGRLTRGRYGRMARISRLGARLWTSWLGAKIRRLFTPKSKRAKYDEQRRRRDAEALTQTMGQMKGAFMKIGQMMSFVSDSIPAEYRAALQTLQTQAPPMDFALIRDVAERELGMPLERAFAKFDETPLASASIGQVHRAVLPTGEQVVVKIQYPGVAEAIQSDMKNVGVLYRMMGMFYPALDPKPIVEELRTRIGEELDYSREAANQSGFCEIYAGHPFIRIPKVFESHSTARVLTTEYVSGRTFAEVLELDQGMRDHYGEVLWRFIFGSIIKHGVFNGDPHPGNYIFTDDGQVVFLDFGCIKYFPDEMLENWLTLVRCYLEHRRDPFRHQTVALGFIKEDSPLSAELMYDYFGYFYEPIDGDREYTFTREYNARSMEMVFKPEGKFKGMQSKLNMPPDFVFVNRIQWGVYSILAQLGATGNWHAIHREYLYGDAPRTELGASEQGGAPSRPADSLAAV
jgi:predicted unusual protein kinase regulating ubiquinone biosynthesis (AarF/ABC1/UbiB family)